MQGFFKAVVHDASGFGKTPEEMDHPFLEAIKVGRLQELLDSLPVMQKAAQSNQVFHSMSRFLLSSAFGTPGWTAIGSAAGMSNVELNTLSTEPTYTEYSDHSGNSHADDWDSDSVGATYTLWKWFFQHSSEPFRIWSDPDGREGYYFRDRFLWLPSNGLMSNIRGARAHFASNADGVGGYASRSWFARTRFKDSGGNPITMEKTASQSFLIEYLLKFFAR